MQFLDYLGQELDRRRIKPMSILDPEQGGPGARDAADQADNQRELATLHFGGRELGRLRRAAQRKAEKSGKGFDGVRVAKSSIAQEGDNLIAPCGFAVFCTDA